MSYMLDKNVVYLVVHYSATPIEKSFWIEDIDRMHRQRGFKEVGYHYFVRRNGDVQTGRDLSQPGRFEMGAHAKGNNHRSIGICYEGGVTEANPDFGWDTRTELQRRAMIVLLRELLGRYPNAQVIGHRDMPGAATQCPGFDVEKWWAEVNRPVDPMLGRPIIVAPHQVKTYPIIWAFKQMAAAIRGWLTK